MRDYAADGVQMFPTSDEPSGYNLHSVRIAGLFVREIAEVEVLTLYTPALHSNKLEHARIRARFRGVLCPVLWCSNASAMEQVDVPDDGEEKAKDEKDDDDDDPRQVPTSAIERGTVAAKHAPRKAELRVKAPTYIEMKKKQSQTQLAQERGGEQEEADSDDDEPTYIEYVCIDVE